MRITDLFIRRPVMTTLVMLAVMGFGLFAFRKLPVSDLPNVDFPTIQVNANLPALGHQQAIPATKSAQAQSACRFSLAQSCR